MGEECTYSFGDLFKAAHNREPDQNEAMTFVMASQDERNKLIKEWAKTAGWGTEDRVWKDGKTYTAFHPNW